MIHLVWMLGCGGEANRPTEVDETLVEDSAATEERTGMDVEGYPCSVGEHCADEGPFLGDTCCAFGDALVQENEAANESSIEDDDYVEYTAVRTVGDFVLVNNIYGLEVWSLSDLSLVHSTESEVRWNELAIGPEQEEGWPIHTVFKGVPWFEFVETRESWLPELKTSVLSPSGAVTVQATFDMSERSFTTIARVGDYLYVGEPDQGVVVFEPDTLTEVYQLALPNVFRVRAGLGGLVALTDEEVVFIDLTDPARPSLPDALRAPVVSPVDLVANDTEVWVAQGGYGVTVFDGSLKGERVPGFEQGAWAVARSGRDVVVSAWDSLWVVDAETRHVVDRETHSLVGSPTLGLFWSGDTLLEAGWSKVRTYRYRPGHISPHLEQGHRVETSSGAWRVPVTNHGPIRWLGSEVSVSSQDVVASFPSMELAPWATEDLVLTGDIPEEGVVVELRGDDPDGPLVIDVRPPGEGLSVGDLVSEAFAPLTATGSLDDFIGKVTLLDYFALY